MLLLPPRRAARRRTGGAGGPTGHHPHDRPTDIDWAIGAVHCIRGRRARGATPYDERWFMYVEDLDCCWQLARRGWRRRLEADVEIVHVGNAAGAQAWGDERTRAVDDRHVRLVPAHVRPGGDAAVGGGPLARRRVPDGADAATLGCGAIPWPGAGLRELWRLLPLQAGPMVTGRVPTEGRVERAADRRPT